MTNPAFPRSASYDPDWVWGNLMGPNVFWLTEWLADGLELEPRMRVLDLGCGRALSSIFLAKEFGVQVWATDLWIPADENWARIREAGVEDRVVPIRAEARSLPYAGEFFDAAVSVDAYHYFGTEETYLGQCLAPLVKPGGQLGIVVPSLVEEFDRPPAHLEEIWASEPEMWTLHSADWWRRHWEKTGLVEIETAGPMPDGWRHWLRSLEETQARGHSSGPTPESDLQELAMIREDAGRTLGFARLVARRAARS